MPEAPEIPEASDPFEKRAAATIAILAVALAVIGSKGDNAKTDVAANRWAHYQSKSISLKTAMESRKRTQGTQRRALENHGALTQWVSGCPGGFPVRIPVSVPFAFSCGKSHRRI